MNNIKESKECRYARVIATAKYKSTKSKDKKKEGKKYECRNQTNYR